jgi:hypothetical protein
MKIAVFEMEHVHIVITHTINADRCVMLLFGVEQSLPFDCAKL